MHKIFKNTLPGLALLGLVLGGCQPELEAPKADKGSADFSKYVAVGNSLTAGYQSGGLSNASQANSYPAMLAMQFKKAGGGDFVQPTFKAGQENGSGYLSLAGFNANGTPRLVPVTTSLALTGEVLPKSGQLQLTAYDGAQPNNLGVPGISVISSVSALTGGLAPYGEINPFFNRLLPAAEAGTTDYLTYIGRATPTFFTFWLGNNDVLTYATNGGVASAANPFSGLSDTTRFGIGYRALLGTISKNGTVKGAVANIPGVTALPYFTTVRVAAINASIKANPALPNAAMAGLYITTGKGEVRAATGSDLLVLTSTGVIGTPSTDANNPFPVGVGYAPTQSNPLPSQYVLDADEISAIATRTAQLNSIIAKSARQYKQPLVDMATLFTGISANGIATNGVTNTTSFISGNLFSLDGVHPTPRGYAIVANEFIRVINQTYGASVPFLNPNEYPGIPLP